MPDELLLRVEQTAERIGRPWRIVLAELMAHYELQDQDRRAADARRRQQEYLSGRTKVK